jgi:hypothetical protein
VGFTVIIDNKKCDKDVKNVKIKITRHFSLRAEGEYNAGSDEILFNRYPIVCKAG